MAIRYIGDWHYGHQNILAYDNRPFNSVEDMNRTIIENWNKVVKQEDLVYVLGDMFWCGAEEATRVLDGLKGRKILIRGNHDKCKHKPFVMKFEGIYDYLEIVDNARNIVLCHYPIPCFKCHFYGWYHLYAHVHQSFEANMMEHVKREMEDLYGHPCRMYNTGAMMPYMNYAPRTLDEIISGAGER